MLLAVLVKKFQIFISNTLLNDIITDNTSATVGHEILNTSADENEQFVKNYIDSEEKEYKRLVDEYEWQGKIISLLDFE